jgi:two-component system OmpR family response regulator
MNVRPRILVIDDEPDIRLIVGLNLDLLGMGYAEAQDGEEAARMIEAESFAGCVLDLAMPRADGYTVLRTLEARGPDDFAIVVLSAKGSPTDAIKAMRMGAHAHLTKPFSPVAVARTVKELVELAPEERAQRRAALLRRAGELDRLGMPKV